ncbi:nitrate reductase molybdenum cofactor assembly chaperone [Actinacidiphila bryophytorum]|uniref:nitrate reductase molybdenum cofactor assembly chaperone n=1 Tax=Actinacidiphila bryophytorum TaxID=1436133 RepID=UPI002176CB7B|nr:nitrate reductase molybdenum cofactor assembly chaperone [Actinacidiphila bryophytorum]UWE10889.1 nitrate reductase molybdenum cofactor assembly chaperone [Actinacidiphila bryophytorum]
MSARGAEGDRHAAAVVHQAAARLLGYPDPQLPAELPLLRAALDATGTRPAQLLRPLLDHLGGTALPELTAGYVRTFDFTTRHCLHLTWWTDGDTRRRGQALVRFKERYRQHGLEPAGEELPDFLPVVLEFSAAARTDVLLREHRPALELLRLALTEDGTPYAAALEAVCATLPGASPADRAAAMAMARSGPPREEVGLTPYGHLGLLPVVGT